MQLRVALLLLTLHLTIEVLNRRFHLLLVWPSVQELLIVGVWLVARICLVV